MKSLTKVIAGTLGLAGFGIAILAGLAAGNSGIDVLLRALGAMVICHVIGLLVGTVGERTVNEYVRSYFAARNSTPAEEGGIPVDNSVGTVEKHRVENAAG